MLSNGSWSLAYKNRGTKRPPYPAAHRVVPSINHPLSFLSLLNYHICFFLKKIDIRISFWLLWVFVAASGGCPLVAVCRFLTAVAALVAELGLWGAWAQQWWLTGLPALQPLESFQTRDPLHWQKDS